MDCIFCRIASGEVQSNIVFQDELAVAFPDINPKAPVHLLVVPRQHIESLDDLTDNDAPLMGHLVSVATELAREKGLSGINKGYRLVINCGPEGGQLVPHLHLHVLGGQPLGDIC
jgi:histidine triad (HIT) family protein